MKHIFLLILLLTTSTLYAQDQSLLSKLTYGLFTTDQDLVFSKHDLESTYFFVSADNIEGFDSINEDEEFGLGMSFGNSWASLTEVQWYDAGKPVDEHYSVAGTPISHMGEIIEWNKMETTKTSGMTGVEQFFLEQGVYFQGDTAWGIELSVFGDIDPFKSPFLKYDSFELEERYYVNTAAMGDAPVITEMYRLSTQTSSGWTLIGVNLNLPYHYFINSNLNHFTVMMDIDVYTNQFRFYNEYYPGSAASNIPLGYVYTDRLINSDFNHRLVDIILKNEFDFGTLIPGHNKNAASFTMELSTKLALNNKARSRTIYDVTNSGSGNFLSDLKDEYEYEAFYDWWSETGFDTEIRQNVFFNLFEGGELGVGLNGHLGLNYDRDYQPSLSDLSSTYEKEINYLDIDGDTIVGDEIVITEREYSSSGATDRYSAKFEVSTPIALYISPSGIPLGLVLSVKPSVSANLHIDYEHDKRYTEKVEITDGTNNIISKTSQEIYNEGSGFATSNDYSWGVEYGVAIFWQINELSSLYISSMSDNLTGFDAIDIELQIGF